MSVFRKVFIPIVLANVMQGAAIAGADENSCPLEQDDARDLVNKFIFPGPDVTPIWADPDRMKDPDHLIPDLAMIEGRRDIRLLKSAADNEICRQINAMYSDLVSRAYESDDGNTRVVFDVGYYQAGKFYLVVFSLNQPPQPDDPNKVRVTTASNYIIVLNKKMELIFGYRL